VELFEKTVMVPRTSWKPFQKNFMNASMLLHSLKGLAVIDSFY
jgi:hypothetical protein